MPEYMFSQHAGCYEAASSIQPACCEACEAVLPKPQSRKSYWFLVIYSFTYFQQNIFSSLPKTLKNHSSTRYSASFLTGTLVRAFDAIYCKVLNVSLCLHGLIYISVIICSSLGLLVYNVRVIPYWYIYSQYERFRRHKAPKGAASFWQSPHLKLF